MAQVSEDAIITLEEARDALLRSDASDELKEKVFTDGGKYDAEGIAGIEDASEEIRRYLNRDIKAQEYEVLTASRDWKEVERTPDSDYPYQLRLDRLPSVPVLKVDGDYKLFREWYVFAKDESADSVTLYAGYRREDQNLQDLGLGQTFGSDSDVPTYPKDIVQVAKRLTIYYATQKVKGLIGVSSESQTIAEFQTQVSTQNYRADYVNRQLKNLQSYRFMS